MLSARGGPQWRTNVNYDEIIGTFVLHISVAGLADGLTFNKSDRSDKNDSESAGTEAKKAAIAEIMNGINDMVRESNQELKPTGTVREGYQFNVILNTDIRIRPYVNN